MVLRNGFRKILRLVVRQMSKSVKDLLFGITINKIDGYFNCSRNNLISLVGSPKSVGGYFNCSNNNLTSLEGSPESVEGDFNCFGNNLTSLVGSPESVGGDFYCLSNPKLLKTYKSEDGIKNWIQKNVKVGGQILVVR